MCLCYFLTLFRLHKIQILELDSWHYGFHSSNREVQYARYQEEEVERIDKKIQNVDQNFCQIFDQSDIRTRNYYI